MIELKEHEEVRLSRDRLSERAAEFLFSNYGKYIDIEFPSFKNGKRWCLRSKGWVGFIPPSKEADLEAIALLPKVPIQNLFRMLEYAYRLKSISFLKGASFCSSIADFYDRLGTMLALQVLERCKKGIYKAYSDLTERRAALTGRLEISGILRRPWDPYRPCTYQEHLSDIEDNQILAWTLDLISRSACCSDRIRPLVHHAQRTIASFASTLPFSAKSCTGRLYSHLNSDYEPMHAICRFFLDHSGPVIQTGSYQVIPFLVNMASLFELFLAEWLRKHLPAGYSLQAKESHYITDDESLSFEIDIVIYSPQGETFAVLDAKYKDKEMPQTADIFQISYYSQAKNCRDAVLIYPSAETPNLKIEKGGSCIRTLSFDLDGDLEESGAVFLSGLMPQVPIAVS